MKIGVLALQGDFSAHIKALARIGAEGIEIRKVVQLDGIMGLVIPGGESSTMLKFIDGEGFREPLIRFARSGRPILGTCAGAIILAAEVTNPSQHSLNLIDISIRRNAYGRQVDSFVGEATTTLPGGSLEAVFIRAPKIERIGRGVETLATCDSEPILVREKNIIAATFHPELTTDSRVHSLLLK